MFRRRFLPDNILLMVLISSCSSLKKEPQLPYYNTPDFTPRFFTAKEDVLKKVTHSIADFSFMDQNGLTITQKNVEGKIHVADFIFTKCGSICPVLTQHLFLVQQKFEKDTAVVLLSYSVTPWIDSVARLKKYAGDNRITSPNWHLLTGNTNDIYKLARQSYFAEEDLGFTKDSTDFLHTEHILLIDRNKHIRGIYNGTLELEIEQLIKDIVALKRES